jgi:hypothetical protein
VPENVVRGVNELQGGRQCYVFLNKEGQKLCGLENFSETGVLALGSASELLRDNPHYAGPIRTAEEVRRAARSHELALG